MSRRRATLRRELIWDAVFAVVFAVGNCNAMLHLSKPNYLRDLLARSRWEFAIATIVIAGAPMADDS
jgi:hypothetical protein